MEHLKPATASPSMFSVALLTINWSTSCLSCLFVRSRVLRTAHTRALYPKISQERIGTLFAVRLRHWPLLRESLSGAASSRSQRAHAPHSEQRCQHSLLWQDRSGSHFSYVGPEPLSRVVFSPQSPSEGNTIRPRWPIGGLPARSLVVRCRTRK